MESDTTSGMGAVPSGMDVPQHGGYEEKRDAVTIAEAHPHSHQSMTAKEMAPITCQ